MLRLCYRIMSVPGRFADEDDSDVRAVARAVIAEWASGAKQVVTERVRAHRGSAEKEGREFWRRVELSIQDLQAADTPGLDVGLGSTRENGISFWTRLACRLKR
jgi:hypothetical protein